MAQEILDPVAEYETVFRQRFEEVAKNTFEELSKEAEVDIEANKRTCKDLYDTQKVIVSVQKRIKRWFFFCVLLWISVVGGALYAYATYEDGDFLMLTGVIAAIVLIGVFLFMKVHPRLKELNKENKDLAAKADELQKTAWAQMSPLNRLYDWDLLMRMMTKTLPGIQFDPYFTTQRLADLKMTYGWDDSFNNERSVLYSHSGLINGNPFVFCRTRKMEMGRKTYEGRKTIHWTTRELWADGKFHSVRHSQTLVATVTAPYPGYYEATRLIYGNTAAPDLIFARLQSGLASKAGSFSFKRHLKALRKKARDLTNNDYAMMTNEEFEVAFDTSNRNNNQQYALLFSPLAQENMMKLLQDDKVGFGDDFDFDKNKMINVIMSNHMQEINLDMNPEQFRHFDYEQACRNFQVVNGRYFKAIYFNLAPLLCVPMYQQIRPQEDIYGRDMKVHSAFWEHEALANFWGQENFKHPECVTDCILKTSEQPGAEGLSTIAVYAHGYRVKRRLTYVGKRGGDGRMHQVPVYWDEYLPVVGNGRIQMQEDNNFADDKLSNHERLQHVNQVLDKSKLNLYRRHIASGL